MGGFYRVYLCPEDIQLITHLTYGGGSGGGSGSDEGRVGSNELLEVTERFSLDLFLPCEGVTLVSRDN